jgi:hypothetical protein
MSSITIATPSSSSSGGCGGPSPSLPPAAPAFSSGGGSPNRTLYGLPLLCAIPSAICRSFAFTFFPPMAMTLQPFCTALLLLPVIRPLTSNVSSPTRVAASLPSVTSTDLTIDGRDAAPGTNFFFASLGRVRGIRADGNMFHNHLKNRSVPVIVSCELA